MKALQEWYPQVFIDLHEMGTDATYYFTPESDPYNPYLTKDQHDDLYWFGKNNAKYFDQFGFRYFTRENYDAFYPGYGASWPFYYGGLAMTYENGSTRGLVVRKSDDTTVTYRETVRRHFVTSIASCEVVAQNRGKLLEMFYRYQVTALEDGAKDAVKEYILPRRGNTSAVDRLAQLLVLAGRGSESRRGRVLSGGQGVSGGFVRGSARTARAAAGARPAGSAGLHGRQVSEGRGAAAQAAAAQRDLRRHRLVAAAAVQRGIGGRHAEKSAGQFPAGEAGDTPPGKVTGKATVAYLVPWGTTAAAKMLTTSLHEGLRVLQRRQEVHSERAHVSGRHPDPDGEGEPRESGTRRCSNWPRARAPRWWRTNSSWVDEGPNFGSSRVVYMKHPAILMAWDRPTNAGSAGQTRFVLERQFGYPVTVIRTAADGRRGPEQVSGDHSAGRRRRMPAGMLGDERHAPAEGMGAGGRNADRHRQRAELHG